MNYKASFRVESSPGNIGSLSLLLATQKLASMLLSLILLKPSHSLRSFAFLELRVAIDASHDQRIGAEFGGHSQVAGWVNVPQACTSILA